MSEARRRYQGPPGDDGEYWLPRDRDQLDKAWDRYFAEHPDRDVSRNAKHAYECWQGRDGTCLVDCSCSCHTF